MKPEIKLESRDGEDNRLIRIGGEDSLMFKLNTEFNYRVGTITDNPYKYSFIDPSGGPFIRIGSIIEGHVVKAIHEGGIIEFES